MDNREINKFNYDKTKVQYSDFLKSNSLPKSYNSIEETESFYILHKNSHLPSNFAFPFKDITAVFSQASNGWFKIHSLHYPKDKYSIDTVQKIAKSTLKCRYCLDGQQGVNINSISESYLNPNSLGNINDLYLKNKENGSRKTMSEIDKAVGTVSNELKKADIELEKGLKEIGITFGINDDISIGDFMLVNLGTALGNQFIDMNKSAGGQLLSAGLFSIGQFTLAAILSDPTIKSMMPKWIPEVPNKWLNRMKLAGISYLTQIPFLFIGGAQYGPEFLEEALDDLGYAFDGIVGGYGPDEILEELFDFDFNFDFSFLGGDYLPYENEDYMDVGISGEEMQDLAKIM